MKKRLFIGIIALISAILIFGGGYFLGESQVAYRTIYIVDKAQEQIHRITRDTTFHNIETISFSNPLCHEWISDIDGEVIFIPFIPPNGY